MSRKLYNYIATFNHKSVIISKWCIFSYSIYHFMVVSGTGTGSESTSLESSFRIGIVTKVVKTMMKNINQQSKIVFTRSKLA